jgi:type II secretory pathway component PulK
VIFPLPERPVRPRRDRLGVALTVFAWTVLLLAVGFLALVLGVSHTLHANVERQEKQYLRESRQDAGEDLARLRLAARDGRVSDEELYWVTRSLRGFEESAAQVRVVTGHLRDRDVHCYALVMDKPLGPRSPARLVDGGRCRPLVFPTVPYADPTATPSSVSFPGPAPG